MARKVKIDTETLITLIDQFYSEKCENPSQLKIPALGNYIREHGYADVEDYLIRRNTVAREHIELLKNTADTNFTAVITTFKTLDADAFIEKHNTTKSLKKALMERDMYYQKVAASAKYCIDNYKDMQKENRAIKREITELKVQNEKNKKEIVSISAELKERQLECKKLQELLNTYVYPEIANELLKKEGLLKETPGIINTDALEKNIISADTEVKIENNVIRGLFDKL